MRAVPGEPCNGSQPVRRAQSTLSPHGSPLLHTLCHERRTRALERMERGHRAHAPARRTQGFEGIAPAAGRELRDRSRGHQDFTGRQTALIRRRTAPNPLADLLSLHRKSAFSSPRPPKPGAFFILGHKQLPGFPMHRFLVVITAAVLTACATAPPPPPAPAPPPAPVLKSGRDLAGCDRRVRPPDDLYRFVGGSWVAKARQ